MERSLLALRNTRTHTHCTELGRFTASTQPLETVYGDLHGLRGKLAFSDGYAVSLNEDDEMVYCIGKGPSATTIDASPKFHYMAVA
jgi:hypothetical protein